MRCGSEALKVDPSFLGRKGILEWSLRPQMSRLVYHGGRVWLIEIANYSRTRPTKSPDPLLVYQISRQEQLMMPCSAMNIGTSPGRYTTAEIVRLYGPSALIMLLSLNVGLKATSSYARKKTSFWSTVG